MAKQPVVLGLTCKMGYGYHLFLEMMLDKEPHVCKSMTEYNASVWRVALASLLESSQHLVQQDSFGLA
jgi:hypothetical protein